MSEEQDMRVGGEGDGSLRAIAEENTNGHSSSGGGSYSASPVNVDDLLPHHGRTRRSSGRLVRMRCR